VKPSLKWIITKRQDQMVSRLLNSIDFLVYYYDRLNYDVVCTVANQRATLGQVEF
jgi:hypothetical protein